MNNKEFYTKKVLTKIKSEIKKYKIIGFDIETHGYKNKFLIGGLYDENYTSYLTKEEMMHAIIRKSEKYTYFTATNLGFDFQALYYGTRAWNDFKLILRGGNTITARHKNTIFIDTMNYTPASVKKLGEMLNIPKLYYKENIGKIPKTKNQWRHMKEYNARDCLISKKAVETFQEIFNTLGCEIKLTLASTAMDLYRRKYMPCKIYKEPIECKEFIYEGYYGGRVECFKRGKLKSKGKIRRGTGDNVYYWMDYNSAYPYQMCKEYPLPSSAKRTTNSSIKIITTYHGTSKVTVTCPYMKYPLLPHKVDDKLIFPYGTFTGTWNHIELKEALRLGYTINKIHETVYYTKTFYPFKDYIIDLYNKRLKYKKEGNDIMSDVCKILMNALYGKFAMRHMQDITFYDLTTMTDEEIQQYDKEGIFDDMQVTDDKDGKITKGYQEYNKECDQNYVLPILSSCVTSYQRVQLHRDIVKTNALYCDTDSILTELKFEDSSVLGGLKIEKLVSMGWLIRPKCYMIYDKTIEKNETKENYNKEKGWNIKVKGIRGMTSEKFYDILSRRGINQIKFMKVKEAVKRKYTPNQKILFQKIQSIEDDKRVWNGKFDINTLQDSEPICIQEQNL